MCRAGLLLLAAAQLLQASLSPQGARVEDALSGMSIVSYQPLDEETQTQALRFSPPQLALGARPLGSPHSERVDVVNGSNRTVRLSSITASTVHFHSSFFESRQVPPNGNTSFDVVFLAREEGDLDADLFIRTSEGVHKYTMSATGIPSAYRLPPLLRLSLPQNATYSPLVYMHNPHDYPVQITEVYSSGGNVLLELPGGGLEGPQTLWLLPPRTTRPIVAVRYDPPPLSLHRPPLRDKDSSQTIVSFVRIKFHGIPSMLSSVLVVAVEIVAFSEPGPYAVPQSVNFGYGGTLDAPAKVRLFAGNSSPRPIRVSSVSVEAEDGTPFGALRVTNGAKMSLPPYSPPNVNFATLTLNWKKVYDSGICCGKIVIKTKPDRRIELPFTSRVLDGGLVLEDESITKYLSSDPGIGAIRQVSLKNKFNVGVHVSELIVGKEMEKYFEVSGFRPLDFEENSVRHGFKIQLKNWTKSLRFESKITLITNVSAQIIPVHVYNGKLDLLMSIPPRPSKRGTLDLGLVPVSSTSRAALFLHNPNPAPVCLRSGGSDVSGVALRLSGCVPQIPAFSDFDAASDVTACTCIPADWNAVYVVSTVAPAIPSSLSGELWVATAHERLVVPVALTSAEGGRLTQPEPVGFGDCFPGTLCTLPLKIESSFPVDMDVVSVEAVPSDRRVYYAKRNDGPSSTIAASKLNEIGWLHYDPYLYCEGKCYTGLDLNSTVGSQWLSLITLPRNTLETDVALVRSRYFLFTNLTAATPSANISVRVDTTQVRNHILPASVSFVWPKLYAGPSAVTAPVSQVGRPAIFYVNLANPSRTRPVLVQLVFDRTLGDDDDEWRAIPKGLHPPDCSGDERGSDRAFFFSRINETDCEDGDDSGLFDVDWLPDRLRPHPDTYLFDLPPGGERNVSVTFLTHYPRKASSVLYIRNNLTIIETLRLTGRGAAASLKFGNRKPGSDAPLLFDMTEKHLKDCEKDKAKKSPSSPPNFTVKRTLVARNTGAIPVKVSRFFVNGLECEGYGFRVLDCEPFELAPNGTRKVDVAFTPDFTLTKVRRLLVLETSLSDLVNFTLAASVPISLTAKCAAALKRPSWEGGLSGAAVSVLACIGACVAVAGVYESYKILGAMTASLLKEPGGDPLPPFDLRAIGQMGLSKKPDGWKCCSLKDISSIKIHNWSGQNPQVEIRGYPPVEEVKPSQPQKCEEPIVAAIAGNAKHKKKAIKKIPDQSESSVTCRDARSKDKFAKSAKGDSSRKTSIPRGSLESSSKCVSENNSSDSGEARKAPVAARERTCENSEKKSREDEDPEAKRDSKHSKSKCDSVSSQSCEEDASSVSAESSNNEEADKENDKRKSGGEIVSAKSLVTESDDKPKRAPRCKYANYEGDGEDEEYDHKSRSSRSSSRNGAGRRRPKSKDARKSDAANKTPDPFECPDPASTKRSKRENQRNNQKRDKQPASKKRSPDKNLTLTGKSDANRSSPPFGAARSSPTAPPVAVWENRASFSDVVARSDGSPSAGSANRKEHRENKRADQKVSSHSNQSASNQSRGANKFKTEEPRKADACHHSDLGPIGSNYYSKRSAAWTDTHGGRYGLQTLQSLREQSNGAPTDSNLNNGYFFGSNDYYSGSVYSDANANGFVAPLNPIGHSNRLQYAPGGSVLRNLSPEVCDSSSDLNCYRMPDDFTTPNLLDLSNGTVDDLECQKNPWNRTTTDSSAAIDSDKMFNLDYGRRNFYDSDAFTNLWNSPPNNMQSAAIGVDPRQLQTSSNSTTSSDRGAAEWLWGYNNSADNSVGTDSVGVRPDASQPQSSHFLNHAHYQHRQESFDPFRANSIWSTGPATDPWIDRSAGERSGDGRGRANVYQ